MSKNYPGGETAERIIERKAVWDIASEMVSSIVKEHPLEPLRGGKAFVESFTTSEADQHVDLILRAAQWLMGE